MSNHEQSSSSSIQASPTPLPVKRISVLGLILAANNTSIWMIFAFLPFMVEHYYPSLSAKELGFKAGLLGSAFSTGGLCGNFMWGVLSDRIGRRPALMYGLFGTAVSSLAFGFAPSYQVAIVTRFMWGFLNGNIGVSRTYIGEILDDTNTSKGMALFGVIGGVGRTVGPVIGGFLAMPADHYPIFRGTLFEKYPFCLPCLVISISCFFILILAYFQLVETLVIRKKMDKSKSSSSITRRRNSTGESYTSIDTSEELDSPRMENDGMNELDKGQFLGKRRKLVNGRKDLAYGLLSDDEENALHNDNQLPSAINNPIHASASQSTASLELTPMKKASASLGRSPSRSRKENKKVSFAGLVMVKVIGSDLLAYGNLKKIDPVEEPLLPQSTSSHRSNAHETSRNKMITSPSPQEEEVFHRNRPSNSSLNNNNTISASAVLPPNVPRYSNGSSEFEASSTASASLSATLKYLLTRQEVLITTSLYGFNGFIQLAANEIFPLWVVTSPADGGFGYNSYLIGIITMVTGPITIFMQLVVYPYLAEQYGVLRVYRYGVTLFAIGVFLIPTISSFPSTSPNSWISFVSVISGLTIMSVSAMWTLITIFVLINNSCYSHQRGTVNGIAQTFSSIGRLFGPYFGANVFAWSETNGMKWPMNYYFTWYLLGILALLFMQLSFFLPRSIQRRKREPKAYTYAASEENRDEDEDAEEGLIYRDDEDMIEDSDMDEDMHGSRRSGYRGYEVEEDMVDSHDQRQVDSEKKDEEIDIKVSSSG